MTVSCLWSVFHVVLGPTKSFCLSFGHHVTSSLSPSFSVFFEVSRPWMEQLFAPEALWVCVAVVNPPVMPAVLLPDVNNIMAAMMKISFS